MSALCFAGASNGGVITFYDSPEAAGDDIIFARGLRDRVIETVSAQARHAYDGVTLLVPGLPEAEHQTDRVAILRAFADRVEARL